LSLISVDIYAQRIRTKNEFLITLLDVTDKLTAEKQLREIRNQLDLDFSRRSLLLERANEELAYRASQTEHVNAELIMINEQLQHVNKKISTSAEEIRRKHEQLNKIFLNLSDVVWSFNLTGSAENFLSLSAEQFYEDEWNALNKIWFWLDYVHPEDVELTTSSYRKLMETGTASCTYRIVTGKGRVRWVFDRLKVIKDDKGNSTIVGSICDVSSVRTAVSNNSLFR
jgi:PAS domain-containing protein